MHLWVQLKLSTDGALVLLKDFRLIMEDVSGKTESLGDYGLIWKQKAYFIKKQM